MGRVVIKNYKDGPKILTEEDLAALAPSPTIKKLSKAGEWAKAHPEGLTVHYCDLKAVMK